MLEDNTVEIPIDLLYELNDNLRFYIKMLKKQLKTKEDEETIEFYDYLIKDKEELYKITQGILNKTEQQGQMEVNQMTDNKLWDTVIEPKMDVEIIPNALGKKRGIKMYCHLDNGFRAEVEENNFDSIGTNYKKARQNLINKVRKGIKER